MLAKSAFTGVTSFADIKIQKKISHLLIISSGDVIDAEKLSLSITVNGSQSIVIPEMKIREAALKSQFLNGYMSTTKQAGGEFVHEFLIELSKDGSPIDIVGDNYLSLNLSALTSGNTYTVYGIEAPNAKRVYLQTSTQSIAGSESQQKTVALQGNPHGLFIRNNGGWSLIRFWFTSGEEASYTPAELRALTRELNGISEAADQLIEGDAINQTILNGAAEMFFFPLNSVYQYEITTVGGTDAVIFTEEEKSF